MPEGMLKGLNSSEAVEEIAHEIRSRQLSILSLVQLLRRIEAGESEAGAIPDSFNTLQGLESIQLCVHEIADLLDSLVNYVREQDSP